MRAIKDIQGDSTPGYPYCINYATNADVFENEGVENVANVVLYRLKLLLSVDGESLALESTPERVLEKGYADPVYVFLKDESHPPRKVILARWRIICGVSLVDQIIERVLAAEAVMTTKDFPNLPITTGVGFTDEMVTAFGKEVKRKFPEGTRGSDVPNWDARMRLWLMLMTNRCDLDRMEEPQAYTRLRSALTFRVYLMANALYVVGGFVLAKLVAGMMASGSWRTTDFNSFARRNVSFLCGSDDSYEAGDDCLEDRRTPLDVVARGYQLLGYPLREVTEFPPWEFVYCSHYFWEQPDGTWKAELLTWQKAIHKFLSVKGKMLEQVLALKFEFRHTRDPELKSRLFGLLDYWEERLQREALSNMKIGCLEGDPPKASKEEVNCSVNWSELFPLKQQSKP